MQKNFESATESYLSAIKLTDETFVTENREIFHKLTQCFYELGEYDRAISVGNNAVEMNKYYEGVYEYLALAHKAKGDYEKAIQVMTMATYYEDPWDQDNTAKVKSKLAELISSCPSASASASASTDDGK